MSRIFEALNKASQAKKEHETGVEVSTDFDRADIPANGNGSNPEWHWDKDRSAAQNALAVSPVTAVSQSWRDKIEELFFGWDLRRYQRYPIAILEHESPAAEQYKILREQIKRLRNETGARFLAITSPVKQDGKTTVAVNLAAAMALEYEEEVLLIDADLRAPQIHRYFGSEIGPGLADSLSSNNHGDVLAGMKDTFLPGLKILPAGHRSDVAAELLSTAKMRNLMEEVRSRLPNHQIIVDTPPILSTPDPLILSREVDGIIMVIRARKTPRNYLLKAIQSLSSSKLVGIVLNDVNLGINSRYYYYYPHKQT